MKGRLLTDDRLKALSRINRWGGWVNRDYSVLEHEVIGGFILKTKGFDPRPFLIHDHEESEFGDVIAPVKKMCDTVAYRLAVAEFNRDLELETGVVPDGGDMDRIMAHAEHLTVAIRGDRVFDSVIPCEMTEMAVKLIEMKVFAGRQTQIDMWWTLWA